MQGCWAKARFIAIVLGLAAALAPASASAAGGGLSPAAPEPPVPPGTPAAAECAPGVGGLTGSTCAPVRTARLIDGDAVPPLDAPEQVKAAIEAANLIHTKPYIWGGGHGRWRSPGYDCSGAVSFALHGGDLLGSPLTSGEMMSWGAPGKGRWITVYANAGHAFAVIDGLRWDTVGDSHGTGPRWHRAMVSTAGFVARHPLGF